MPIASYSTLVLVFNWISRIFNNNKKKFQIELKPATSSQQPATNNKIFCKKWTLLFAFDNVYRCMNCSSSNKTKQRLFSALKSVPLFHLYAQALTQNTSHTHTHTKYIRITFLVGNCVQLSFYLLMLLFLLYIPFFSLTLHCIQWLPVAVFYFHISFLLFFFDFTFFGFILHTEVSTDFVCVSTAFFLCAVLPVFSCIFRT